MSLEIANRNALINNLYLRTHQQKISWNPYDGGYATYIANASRGFLKIAIQKISDAFCLQIYANNTVMLDETYHLIDKEIFTSLTLLFELLDRKVDNSDVIVNELITYLDYL